LGFFLTAPCLGLSVVHVRTLITNKADFFHPGNCSRSQVCRIRSVSPQSSTAMYTHGSTYSLLSQPPLQVQPPAETVALATQGRDSVSECSTALFPNQLDNSHAWVTRSWF